MRVAHAADLTQNDARKLVQRADKQTGVRQSAVNYALAHIGKPYDLVNVPEECPNISNTCQVGAARYPGNYLFLLLRVSHVGQADSACLMGGGAILVNNIRTL